jgi:hypothetical protein
MTEDADLGLAGLAPFDGGGEPAPRSRLGVVLAALVAAAASAGLAWWVAAPGRSRVEPPPAPVVAPRMAEPPQPLRYAPDEPDPAQVKRAYGDVQGAYTNGGPGALVSASTACAKATPGDPQRLDYCLAFDTYAAEIVSGGVDEAAAADWFADSGSRDLALARSALPAGADAENRLAQVSALAQAVLPKPVVAKPKAKAKPRPKIKAKLKRRPKAKAKARSAPPPRHASHAARRAYPQAPWTERSTRPTREAPPEAFPPEPAPPFGADPYRLDPPH